MRELLIVNLMSSVYAGSWNVLDLSVNGERLYMEENCDDTVCSGYAGNGKNNRLITWKSCNDSIITQMNESFCLWKLSFQKQELPKKCTPKASLKERPNCKPTAKTTTTPAVTATTTTSIKTTSTSASTNKMTTESESIKLIKQYQG